MTQLTLTHTLTAGTNEDVQDVQDNFEDIRDWANGANIDATNLDGQIPTAKIANRAVTVAKQGTVPFCRVRRDANQSIPGWTFISWDTEEHDTDGLHSGGAVTVTTPGHYFVSAMLIAASTATWALWLQRTTNFLDISSSSSHEEIIGFNQGLGTVHRVTGSDYFAAADPIRFSVNHTGDNPINITAYMSVAWIGP